MRESRSLTDPPLEIRNYLKDSNQQGLQVKGKRVVYRFLYQGSEKNHRCLSQGLFHFSHKISKNVEKIAEHLQNGAKRFLGEVTIVARTLNKALSMWYD